MEVFIFGALAILVVLLTIENAFLRSRLSKYSRLVGDMLNDMNKFSNELMKAMLNSTQPEKRKPGRPRKDSK